LGFELKDSDTITKVWLDETQEDCTQCGLCETLAASVFLVPEKMEVRSDADLTARDEIMNAAESCPVSVIALEVNHSKKRDNES